MYFSKVSIYYSVSNYCSLSNDCVDCNITLKYSSNEDFFVIAMQFEMVRNVHFN